MKMKMNMRKIILTKKTFNMTWIMSKQIMGKNEVREIPIEILDSRTIELDGW